MTTEGVFEETPPSFTGPVMWWVELGNGARGYRRLREHARLLAMNTGKYKYYSGQIPDYQRRELIVWLMSGGVVPPQQVITIDRGAHWREEKEPYDASK